MPSLADGTQQLDETLIPCLRSRAWNLKRTGPIVIIVTTVIMVIVIIIVTIVVVIEHHSTKHSSVGTSCATALSNRLVRPSLLLFFIFNRTVALQRDGD